MFSFPSLYPVFLTHFLILLSLPPSPPSFICVVHGSCSDSPASPSTCLLTSFTSLTSPHLPSPLLTSSLLFSSLPLPFSVFPPFPSHLFFPSPYLLPSFPLIFSPPPLLPSPFFCPPPTLARHARLRDPSRKRESKKYRSFIREVAVRQWGESGRGEEGEEGVVKGREGEEGVVKGSEGNCR